MAKIVLTIDAADLSATSFASLYDLGTGRFEGLTGLGTYFQSVCGGLQSGTVKVSNGAIAADGYFTVSSTGSTAGQAGTILNVTLTGRASNPATNEFVVSTTPSVQAANMAAAINASASFTGKVTAVANGARVELTAVVPGALGNGFQASAGNLSNVTLTKAFAGGSDGTTYSL